MGAFYLSIDAQACYDFAVLSATLHADPRRRIGPLDRRIFGGFLEHLGRAVYGGVFQPGHEHSSPEGFRQDVVDVLRDLRMPIVRYPGGNYVSAWNWRDSVGSERPVRADYAWRSYEPNTFGPDEFVAWCRMMDTQPMMAVNLGTRGAEDAAALVEYMNLPRGSHWADLRPTAEPYAVPVWCLGNEMDGPWQAGHVPATEYALRARQAGKLMKGLDPSIQTVACGSSGHGMPTYLEWDRTVLETCWNDVDFISAHRYSENRQDNTDWYLAEGTVVDHIIEDYQALLRYVQGLKKSKHRVFLSFDEWNVWYKNMEMDGGWQVAPPLLEEVYNLEDALAVAQYLMSFIRHCDVVRMACIAQIVNVIAPILVQDRGVLKQSIFHPFRMISESAGGRGLDLHIQSPTYDADDRRAVPLLDAAATVDDAGQGYLYLVNRSTDEELEVSLTGLSPANGELLTGADPKAVNDWETPHRVEPGPFEVAAGALKLPPLAFAAVPVRAGEQI